MANHLSGHRLGKLCLEFLARSILIVLTICYLQGCGGGETFEIGDLNKSGTVLVERVLQSSDLGFPKANCRYIYGVTQCAAFLEPAIRSQYATYGKAALVDSLLKICQPNLAITNLIGAKAVLDIQDYFSLEDSALKDIKLIPFTDKEQPLIRTKEGQFPGEFIEDSIKNYGECYFTGLNDWSLLLQEKWVLESGKVVSKTIEGLQIGLHAVATNRFHPFAKVEFSDLMAFLNRSVSSTPDYINPGFPDTLLPEIFPYGEISLQSAYDKGYLFLTPLKFDNSQILPSDALQLLSSESAFQPQIPAADEIEGKLWVITRFFNPEFAFEIPAERFESAIANGTVNLEKQLPAILGSFVEGKSYRENIRLSYLVRDVFAKELRAKLANEKIPFYNPDSILQRRSTLMGLTEFEAAIERAYPNVGKYTLELEFLVKIKLTRGKQEKDLHYLRLVLHDPSRNMPDKNFRILDSKDIVEVLSKPLPGTPFSLKTFLEEYAFFEIYNMNGKGARTHQDAKDFMSYFYSLHPKPLIYE
jgi:hypothetical protein